MFKNIHLLTLSSVLALGFGFTATGCGTDDDDGSGSDTSAGDGDGDGDVCDPFCVTTSECYDVTYEDCYAECDADLTSAWEEETEECYWLYEDIFWCVSGLTCEEYDQWNAQEGEYPCMDVESAYLESCG